MNDGQQLFDALQAAQDAAKADQPERAYIGLPDGDRVAVAASGVREGLYFHYVLKWQGVEFQVRRTLQFDERFPTIRVELGSLFLMEKGHDLAYEQVRELLAAIGFDVVREAVSRADICVDLPGVHAREFTRHFDWNDQTNSRVIRRARKVALYVDGLETTGFTLGAGAVLLRVYDKIVECQDDPAKMAVLVDRRWGGQLPETATRVEFQLLREKLHERWGVESFADLKAKLPTILEWLTNEWVRLVEQVPDRKNRHQDRPQLSQLWLSVQAAFNAWMGERGETPNRLMRAVVSTKQLVKQGMGCLQTVAHRMGRSVRSFSDAVEFLGDLAKQEAAAFVDGCRQKSLAASFKLPGGLIVPECDIPY